MISHRVEILGVFFSGQGCCWYPLWEQSFSQNFILRRDEVQRDELWSLDPWDWSIQRNWDEKVSAIVQWPATWAGSETNCLKFSCEASWLQFADADVIWSTLCLTTCKFDIVLSKLFKDVFGVTAPWLLSIINESLLSGLVLDYFKQACIQPLLKKPGLDPTRPHNYRPISKLPLVSEIVEKVVAKQLLEIMEGSNIWQIPIWL